MKWKPSVTVNWLQDRYQLRTNMAQTDVKNEDSYIARAIEKGITDDSKLIQEVMKSEQLDEVLANLRLAQFLLDYEEYISNEVGHMTIEL